MIPNQWDCANPQHLPILNMAFEITELAVASLSKCKHTALEMPFKSGAVTYTFEDEMKRQGWNKELVIRRSTHSNYRSQVEEENVAHLLTLAAQKVPGWC